MNLKASPKFDSNIKTKDSIEGHYGISISSLDFLEFPLLNLDNKIYPFHINALLFSSILFTSFKISQSKSFLSFNPSQATMNVVAQRIFACYKTYSYFSTFIHNRLSIGENFSEGLTYHFPILVHQSHF